MSDMLEWRERLEGAHKQMQDAMMELITNKKNIAELPGSDVCFRSEVPDQLKVPLEPKIMTMCRGTVLASID